MTTPSSIAPPQALVQGVSQTTQAVPQIDRAAAALIAQRQQYKVLESTAPGDEVDTLIQDVSSLSPNGGYRSIVDCAIEWTNPLRDEVLSTLQGVVDWSNTFNQFYDKLQQLAVQIATGDTNAVAPFQAILKELQSVTQSQDDLTETVSKSLVDYQLTMDSAVSTVNSELLQLQTDQTNEEKTAQADSSQADETQTQLQNRSDIDKLVQDMTGKTKKEENSAQQNETASQSAQMAANAAGGASKGLTNADTDAQGIADSVGSLNSGWNILVANFSVLIESENITTYNAFTPNQLATVQTNWKDLAAQAATLL